MMHVFYAFFGVNIVHPEEIFRLFYAFVRESYGSELLVYGIIRVLFQLLGNLEKFYIKILGVPGLGRNNQRRARLVYQNRVHFVHDGEVMTSLRHAFQRYGQIVPQIIKAKFMISAVSDIRLISGASLHGLQILVNNFEFADLVPPRLRFPLFWVFHKWKHLPPSHLPPNAPKKKKKNH